MVQEIEQAMPDYIIDEKFPKTIYNFHPNENEMSNITFNTNQTEMLKVAEDGFYVRGKKLDIDDEEARSVYNAFRQWLIWAELLRN